MIPGIVTKCLNARPKTKQSAIDVCLMYTEIEQQAVVQVLNVYLHVHVHHICIHVHVQLHEHCTYVVLASLVHLYMFDHKYSEHVLYMY